MTLNSIACPSFLTCISPRLMLEYLLQHSTLSIINHLPLPGSLLSLRIPYAALQGAYSSNCTKCWAAGGIRSHGNPPSEKMDFKTSETSKDSGCVRVSWWCESEYAGVCSWRGREEGWNMRICAKFQKAEEFDALVETGILSGDSE